MRCPCDAGELEKRLYEGDVEVDRCPVCEGMWLDKGELERIQESRAHDHTSELSRMPDLVGREYELARQKRQRPRNCPCCGEEMTAREYGYCSQVLIDVCPACGGLWLDKGETEALEIFFERCRIEATAMRRTFFGSLLALFEPHG